MTERLEHVWKKSHGKGIANYIYKKETDAVVIIKVEVLAHANDGCSELKYSVSA